MSLQIPSLHISSRTVVKGSATFAITRRALPAAPTGEFTLRCSVAFDPAADSYPGGSLDMDIHLSDGGVGRVKATSFEQVNSWGKHTPTAVLTGRCDVSFEEPKGVGCRFWILIANNVRDPNPRDTPDIASFLIFDRKGARIAYGTGVLTKGNIEVPPGAD